MTTIAKKRFDLSEGDDSITSTDNNLIKVSSGIKLPKNIKPLFYVEYANTRYTLSATIDKIKKVLASVTSNEDIEDRLYYYQAYDFQKLGLYKREDVPAFKIKLSHLPHDIIYELAQYNDQDRKFVLKQSVSRIFEDINYDIYHDSISERLEVELVK